MAPENSPMRSKGLMVVGVFCLLGTAGAADKKGGKAPKETGYTRVKIRGTLEVQGKYIGVKVNPGGRDSAYHWELNFSKNKGLRKTAVQLKGQTVVVAGEIRLVGGTLDNNGKYVGNRPSAPPVRHVVFVTSLKKAKPKNAK
jgi:hypothetical protein